MKLYSTYDVEKSGWISPRDFVVYVTSLPLTEPVTAEEAVLLVKELDTMQDGRIFWKTFGKAVELAAARQVLNELGRVRELERKAVAE